MAVDALEARLAKGNSNGILLDLSKISLLVSLGGCNCSGFGHESVDQLTLSVLIRNRRCRVYNFRSRSSPEVCVIKNE